MGRVLLQLLGCFVLSEVWDDAGSAGSWMDLVGSHCCQCDSSSDLE